MRLQLSKLAVIISFYINTIAATDRPRSFVCERKYFPADVISKAIGDSCNALEYADIKCRAIAAFDGTVLFGIRDAVLFSTPTRACHDHKYEGGNLLILETSTRRIDSRFVIDSMCNLIGLIYLNNRSFFRCAETIDSDHATDIGSDIWSNTLPKNFGYRCDHKIFHYQDILRSFEYLRLQFFKPAGTTTRLKPIKVSSDDFSGSDVYLWPVYADGMVRPGSLARTGLYRIATNGAKNMLGLMYRNNKDWHRCIEMKSVDPKLSTVGDGTKNSIGETIFDNLSAYKCGQRIFSIITLNSHMQAACRVIREDARKAAAGESSFPIPDPAAKHGEINTRFWPLRLPELNGDKNVQRQRYSYLKLDLDCKFLGVFKCVNGKFFSCLSLKASPSSLE